MSGEYGTHFFGTETECKKCGQRAVGVLFDIEDVFDDDNPFGAATPLCGRHRNLARKAYEGDWDDVDFLRFVDA